MSVEGYEILREITRDADHVSYEARQRSTGRRVALQLTLHGPYTPREQRDSLRDRLHTLALLDHPHLVGVLAVGDYDSGCYLVRPLLDATSLPAYLSRSHDPPPVRQAALWAEQLADAVGHCHGHGVFGPHLSLDDVLIEAGEARLNYFHVSHVNFLHPPMPPAPSSGLVGPARCLSPEQIRGEWRPDDPRRDVWALGVLFYRLLTGRMPFDGAGVLEAFIATVEQEPIAPRLLRPEIPADLETICLRCLRKKPEQRYPAVSALSQALQAHLEGRPMPLADDRASLTARMGRWVRGWWAGVAKA